MPIPQETPLEKIKEWPAELVQRLQQSWITTAEQAVATSATPGGLRSLAEQLEVSEKEAARLVSVARAHLDPAVAAQLEQPVDTRAYGLGVLRPPSDEPKP
jgi:DNA-binding GntR family transcriptional regulator